MRPYLLCLVAACGFAPAASSPGVDASSPATDASRDASAGLTPHTFLVGLLTEECDQAFACKAQYPSAAQHTFDYEWGANLAECVATDQDYKDLPAIEAAVAAGRITFDPAQAASCLAAPAIPTTCATLFSNNYDWATSCYAALLGHIADGEVCTTAWECASFSSNCSNAKCTHF